MSDGNRNTTLEVIAFVLTLGGGIAAAAMRSGCGTSPASSAPASSRSPQVVDDRDCKAGVAEACARAGQLAEACRLGSGAACERTARASEEAEDFRRAAADYDRACRLGSARGCAGEEALFLAGKAIPSDPAEAAGWYVKRCEAKDMEACAHAGAYYAGVKEDARALPFLTEACDAKDALACWTLGRAYAEGRGVARSDATAVSKFRIACTGNPSYCFELGRAYESGHGAPRDHARAFALFSQACTAGNADACAAVRAP